jgi:two-component system cell cycle response regulator DivK
MATVAVTSSPLILLVDDFSDALEMYAEYLRYRGFRVATAASGAQAVTVASGAERPAIILMDLEMREMSGTEALRVLRANPALADVPILAFTAHALVAQHTEAMRVGFDGVIPKPCLPDDLVTLIEPYLNRPHRATA